MIRGNSFAIIRNADDDVTVACLGLNGNVVSEFRSYFKDDGLSKKFIIVYSGRHNKIMTGLGLPENIGNAEEH